MLLSRIKSGFAGARNLIPEQLEMDAQLNTAVRPKPSPDWGAARFWIGPDSHTSRSMASTSTRMPRAFRDIVRVAPLHTFCCWLNATPGWHCEVYGRGYGPGFCGGGGRCMRKFEMG